MKLIAGIVDVGTNYEVESVFQGDEASIFQFGGVILYEIPSIECFDAIETALAAGSTILFPKNLSNPLTTDDLVIQEIADEVEAAKVTARTQLRQFSSNRLGSTSMFDYYLFSSVNNVLIDQGYVITNANREAKYLEIVNTGDTDLINALDSYLEVKDSLDENKALFINLRDTVSSLDEETTTAGIQTILDTFYASYS